MEKQTEPMDASNQCCPNLACCARGQIGAGNIRIHSYHPQRYRCQMCHKTFSARRGTMMEGLGKPSEVIVIVVTLLAYGCPIQAIVHAAGLGRTNGGKPGVIVRESSVRKYITTSLSKEPSIWFMFKRTRFG